MATITAKCPSTAAARVATARRGKAGEDSSRLASSSGMGATNETYAILVIRFASDDDAQYLLSPAQQVQAKIKRRWMPVAQAQGPAAVAPNPAAEMSDHDAVSEEQSAAP